MRTLFVLRAADVWNSGLPRCGAVVRRGAGLAEGGEGCASQQGAQFGAARCALELASDVLPGGGVRRIAPAYPSARSVSW